MNYKWRTINQELPEQLGWDLVTDGKIVTIGSWDINGWIGCDPDIKPTHWMPLPKPPSSEASPTAS